MHSRQEMAGAELEHTQDAAIAEEEQAAKPGWSNREGAESQGDGSVGKALIVHA